MRINWEDKARNLREIAAELNIGLDSVAFLDDNPVERQQVREQAAEVDRDRATAGTHGVRAGGPRVSLVRAAHA